MKLLSYNICHAGKRREDAIAAVIRAEAPDLVVLQEAERPDAINRIADLAGMAQFGARRGQSLGFISREPVAAAEWHQPRVSRHAFLELVPHNSRWRIFGVHLSAVHAAWTERRRVFELRALLSTIAAHQHGPHVLVGDFNTLAPGEVLDVRKLPPRLRALVWLSGGRIRWRTIQMVMTAGYQDVFRRHHAQETGFTFPASSPHLRLDYLFALERNLAGIRTCRVGTDGAARHASDHLPLIAELES